MKTVIISSGEIKDYDFCREILSTADYVICADGGTRHAYNMNITPDIIMGDMDSSDVSYIKYYEEKGVSLKKYSPDKDKTDTQLCLEYALEFSSEVVLLGATGSRIDHMLANISLLMLGLEKNIKVSMADDKNRIYLIKDSIMLSGAKGDYFSLIPFTGNVEGVCTEGAHYELHDALMEQGSSYGVSNYFEGDTVKVSIKKGYMLVIKSED
ncbi:MAG: thiamine diphosphokinase [Caulobacteraceae bacterium]